MSRSPDELIVASGVDLRRGGVVDSGEFSGLDGLGAVGVVGPSLGLGQGFELAGGVDDRAL